MIQEFTKYMTEWKELDSKHGKVKIPIVSFFYELWILNKKSTLTREYSEYLESITPPNTNALGESSLT